MLSLLLDVYALVLMVMEQLSGIEMFRSILAKHEVTGVFQRET
jgi:hypothetical protein